MQAQLFTAGVWSNAKPAIIIQEITGKTIPSQRQIGEVVQINIERNMSNTPEKADKDAGNVNKTRLGYAIAIITLGAAFGNMFMAGKIRNVMKMELPKSSAWKADHVRPGPGASTASESAEGATHQPRRPFSSQRPFNIVPDHLLPHLNNLKLPTAPARPEEIKSAYRKAVMQYHPDRMSVKDADLKKLYAVKFRQSTDSYNALIQHYTKGSE
jgi:hypothetical protein